jgi:G:T-mismatch repair DNA endonuclease (very short patch repair protein)
MSKMLAARSKLRDTMARSGHGDFVTYHENMPFDLFWPHERVAVVVLGCISHACPKHGKWNTVHWETVVRRNLQGHDSRMQQMRNRHWTAVAFYECDLLTNPEKCVSKVVDALEARPAKQSAAQSKYGPRSDRALARLTRLDMVSRMPEEAWVRFLEVVRDVTEGERRNKHNVRKRDVRVSLVGNESWSEDAFTECWKGALWHHVLRKQIHGSVVKGELWNAVLEEADIPLA